MTRRRVKVVAFDLDDTLYPERDYMLSGFQAVSEYAATELEIPNFYEMLLQISEKQDTSGRTFNLALDDVGMRYDASLIDNMVSVYHNSRRARELSVYTDVIPALRRLHESYELVLITDGEPDIQRRKIHHLGISQHFARTYCTGEYGNENQKPSPFAFQQTMNDFAISGPECVYVGNDPTKDFVAPNKLGWLTIHIQRDAEIRRGNAPDASHEAQFQITDLKELDLLLSGSRSNNGTSK